MTTKKIKKWIYACKYTDLKKKRKKDTKIPKYHRQEEINKNKLKHNHIVALINTQIVLCRYSMEIFNHMYSITPPHQTPNCNERFYILPLWH